MYAYAHLPQRFKSQRRIDAAQLPRAGQRIDMLATAIDGFLGHGYCYIGMDHFALPDDSLAVAKRQGRLHRNFQGYSTRPDCDLVGLGVSAISRVGPTYSQNAKTLPEYYDALRQGHLPVVRGLALSRDDLVRRAVIMALMCQGWVDFEAIEIGPLDRHGAATSAMNWSRCNRWSTPASSSARPTRCKSPATAGTSFAPWRWSSTST